MSRKFVLKIVMMADTYFIMSYNCVYIFVRKNCWLLILYLKITQVRVEFSSVGNELLLSIVIIIGGQDMLFSTHKMNEYYLILMVSALYKPAGGVSLWRGD